MQDVEYGPHPEEGRRLIDYLLSRDVERQLAQSEASHYPVEALRHN
jgi:ABC-type Fe3+ transport system substrate-binding protein